MQTSEITQQTPNESFSAGSSDQGKVRALVLTLLEVFTGEDLTVYRSSDADLSMPEDVAVDSVVMISIVTDLEKLLDISISNRELTSVRLRSLKNMCDFLLEKISRRRAQ